MIQMGLRNSAYNWIFASYCFSMPPMQDYCPLGHNTSRLAGPSRAYTKGLDCLQPKGSAACLTRRPGRCLIIFPNGVNAADASPPCARPFRGSRIAVIQLSMYTQLSFFVQLRYNHSKRDKTSKSQSLIAKIEDITL